MRRTRCDGRRAVQRSPDTVFHNAEHDFDVAPNSRHGGIHILRTEVHDLISGG